MQPNCDHDDCWDCLELAEECDGFIRCTTTLNLVSVSPKQLSKTKYKFGNALWSISRTNCGAFSRSQSRQSNLPRGWHEVPPMPAFFSKSDYQNSSIYKSK